MKARLILIVVALVILPTAILSIMAGGAVKARELDLEKKLTERGEQAVVAVGDSFEAYLAAIQGELTEHVSNLLRDGKPDGILPTAVNLQGLYDVVDAVYVLDLSSTFIYPGSAPNRVELIPDSGADPAELRQARALVLKGKHEDAAKEYQRINAAPGLHPGTRAEATLGASYCYRQLGNHDFASEILRQLAGYSSGPLAARKLAEDSQSSPRNGNGYLYSMIAMRELVSTYAATAASEGEGRARTRDMMIESMVELLDRTVFLFDYLVPEQSEELLSALDGFDAPELKTNDKWRRLMGLLREQRTREGFTAKVRTQLSDAVLEGPRRDELFVVRAGGYLWTGKEAVAGIVAGFRINSAVSDRQVSRIAADVSAQHGVNVVIGGDPADAGVSASLAAGRLDPPFDAISISAFASDEDNLRRKLELQSRLQEWGILVMVLGVLAGLAAVLVHASEAVKRARARADFIAGISHDLRTPLASMRMFAESLYLGRVKEPEKQKEFLETIVNQSERLGHLVERILFFVRLGEDALSYDMKSTDMKRLVAETVHAMAAVTNVPIHMDAGGDLLEAEVDSVAISQVVLNLIDNAVKYTKAHATRDTPSRHGFAEDIGEDSFPGVNVTVCKRGEKWIEIAVEDHGPGMEQKDLKRIFKKYYRSSGKSRETVSGIGLGLTLCKRVVRAHRGRITAESTLGVGSTFRVLLPLGN